MNKLNLVSKGVLWEKLCQLDKELDHLNKEVFGRELVLKELKLRIKEVEYSIEEIREDLVASK